MFFINKTIKSKKKEKITKQRKFLFIYKKKTKRSDLKYNFIPTFLYTNARFTYLSHLLTLTHNKKASYIYNLILVPAKSFN